MKSWNKPTPDQIDKAIALFGHVQQYRYFFDRLNNPEWIEPLKDRGYFKNPPKPILDDEKKTISYLIWSESRYLAKMAPLAPQVVLDTILTVPDVGNIRVYEDFIEAALGMPPEVAVGMVKKIKHWIHENHPAHIFPDKAGDLTEKLAKAGYTSEALKIANALMDVIPEPKVDDHLKVKKEYSLPKEARARFDAWSYQEILTKNFPGVVEAAGLPALELLCEILNKAIEVQRGPAKPDNNQDYSFIWRPAIEDHSQNIGHGITDILVSAVRDAVDKIILSKKADIKSVIKVLEKYHWTVFGRIAIHALRVHHAECFELVEPYLLSWEIFDDAARRHEYAFLLKDCFKKLTTDQQQIILNWINQGPDPVWFEESYKRNKGTLPTSEESGKYKKFWQRDHLTWIKDDLPKEWKETYQNLVSELGEPEHPDFSSYITSGTGSNSPKTATELDSLSINDLMNFLMRWQPEKKAMSHSKSGLGQVLSAAVANNPEKYVSNIELFKEVNPTYVKALIWGLRDAVNKDTKLDWLPIFNLCSWVVLQPIKFEKKEEDFEEDHDLNGARSAIGDLLSASLGKDADDISLEFRFSIWEIILSLLDDPDPTIEDEAKSSMGPATMSINTTRGKAMHAVFKYALWIRRKLEASGEHIRIANGFDEMPEVREALDKHLDFTKEYSPTIRSVYGQWFPWIVLLDIGWAASRAKIIFPKEPSLKVLWEASWYAYVNFCAPYDNVFSLLLEHYHLAIQHIGRQQYHRDRIADPDEQLAEHLMTFYWRGKISISPDGSDLVSQFFQKASSELRSYALEFVGRSLHQTKDDVPVEIILRLKDLWQARHQNGDSNEISSFGWWFISGKFDDNWASTKLLEALQAAGRIKPDHQIVEKLVTLMASFPKNAIIALDMIVRGDVQGWGVYGWRDPAKQMLVVALQNEDPDIKEAAQNIIHYLGERGYLDFGELLK